MSHAAADNQSPLNFSMSTAAESALMTMLARRNLKNPCLRFVDECGYGETSELIDALRSGASDTRLVEIAQTDLARSFHEQRLDVTVDVCEVSDFGDDDVKTVGAWRLAFPVGLAARFNGVRLDFNNGQFLFIAEGNEYRSVTALLSRSSK